MHKANVDLAARKDGIMDSIRIKICGISSPGHALTAASAGADFIGLVFAPSSRRVTLTQGRAIVRIVKETYPEGQRPGLVGVFVNEPPEIVNEIVGECSLDYAQLSGNETAEVSTAISVPVIKALRPVQEADLNFLDMYPAATFLIDTHHSGSWGGSGKTADWNLAAQAARRRPILLAGGLTADNVSQAIAAVLPWGVDVSSGVETNGHKDKAKIVAFIRAVSDAERSVAAEQKRQRRAAGIEGGPHQHGETDTRIRSKGKG